MVESKRFNNGMIISWGIIKVKKNDKPIRVSLNDVYEKKQMHISVKNGYVNELTITPSSFEITPSKKGKIIFFVSGY